MENVSLLEDLGERQLKTEVRNGEISNCGCNTPAPRDLFFKYYYYYEFYKPRSVRFGHFIFPNPHESEFELSGKKKSSHATTHRGIPAGAGWTLRSTNPTTLLLLELPSKQLFKHTGTYQSSSKELPAPAPLQTISEGSQSRAGTGQLWRREFFGAPSLLTPNVSEVLQLLVLF